LFGIKIEFQITCQLFVACLLNKKKSFGPVRKTLKTVKLQLAIVLAVSLIIILVISRQTAKNQVGNHLLTTAQSRAFNIELLIEDYTQLTKMISTGNSFKDVVDDELDLSWRINQAKRRIKSVINSYLEIERIRILNKSGIVIASSNKDVGFDLSEKTIYLKGKEGVYAGEIHKSEFTEKLVISISAPIFVRDKFSGVLIINFDVKTQLFKITSDRTGLEKTGEIYLINNKGYLITPSRFIDDAILKIKINTEHRKLYLSEHVGKGLSENMVEKPFEYIGYRGNEVLGTHYYISELQWGLIAEIDINEAYRPIYKLTNLLAAIFLFLLIITIIFSIIISRKIALPIRKLHDGTEKIINGNLDYRVGIDSKDEIGQLSCSFDIMTARLAESQKELQKHAEELDGKVRERTSELEKQFEKSEKNRVANLVILNDLNKTTKDLKAEIYERKQAEAQLRQVQKMEALGTLAGGIAHDFNNILSPILGYSEMLLLDTPEDSPFRKDLNNIYTSALRAQSLVKQILTFSRQESSELMLMKMQPNIKEALKLIRSTIPTTIEIKQDVHPDCGVIKADPTQIHQIVMNLATNAYHAMEETGGELKVSLKQVKLGEYDIIIPDMTPGVYVCLTVADTGKGMDKNLTDKIFDPFFTTKEVGKGTGMGLSVVHGIVKGMGGSIHVYSEPGKGTQFHVYLPLAEAVKEQQVTNVEAPIQGGTEHILFVDDEELILQMETVLLERMGYQVTSRTSSIEALEAFRKNPHKFDMVITDMTMPNMSGDKLAVELTKIRPDIPVLLCTGFSETMSEEKALSLGIKGFLLKPIVIKSLDQKIREVLDK